MTHHHPAPPPTLTQEPRTYATGTRAYRCATCGSESAAWCRCVAQQYNPGHISGAILASAVEVALSSDDYTKTVALCQLFALEGI